MKEKKLQSSDLLTSEELAVHIVDTLVDQGLIEKDHFKKAVVSVKWELDAQHGIGRLMLNSEAEDA